MSKMCAIYDTEEVFKSVFGALVDKLGDEEIAYDAFMKWMVSEPKINKCEIDDLNYDTVMDGFCTVETEGGDIWVCMKMFNISRFRKNFGIEPET